MALQLTPPPSSVPFQTETPTAPQLSDLMEFENFTGDEALTRSSAAVSEIIQAQNVRNELHLTKFEKTKIP